MCKIITSLINLRIAINAIIWPNSQALGCIRGGGDRSVLKGGGSSGVIEQPVLIRFDVCDVSEQNVGPVKITPK